jgi:uncharacterized protein (DUF1330 family)
MTAYAIGNITIKDTVKWAEYRRRLPATLAPWGADIVLRGRQAEVLSGQHSHRDVVVLRFPDVASVTGWHDSPEYQALVPLREQAADVDLVCFEADS